MYNKLYISPTVTGIYVFHTFTLHYTQQACTRVRQHCFENIHYRLADLLIKTIVEQTYR